MKRPHLKISLFDKFGLWVDGELVSSLGGDRPITLLAYLLLHRHTPQSRQQLAYTLWPDSTDSQARANLRNLYFTLRHTLPRADSLLLADSTTIQWLPDICLSLDVADFEGALLAAGATESIQEKIKHLEAAVNLYRGDLLPGNYDDWIIPYREEFHQANIDALHQLVALYQHQQEYRAASRIGQKLLQLDPLDETTYVNLMRLHALSGDRAGVRRIFEQCATALQRELDIEPSPATLAAFERFFRQEAPLPIIKERPDELASLRCRPLPVPPTQFIGREAELAYLAELLAHPECRLLTITGPGGMGKTRLALQSAVRHQAIFVDGVVFVPLAPVQEACRLASSVAAAMELEVGETDAAERLLFDYLYQKKLLLILDNFEHLMPGVRLISQLLTQSPRLKLIVTSRKRLLLQEEWVVEINGLFLPDHPSLENLAENNAAALFVHHAHRASSQFQPDAADYEAIFEICELLEGVPLSIELAASWVRIVSCPDILAEIRHSLDFLQATHHHIPERHRNLQAVFDHSWRLLSAREQQILRRLAVIQGSFDRDDAEKVAGATLLDLISLADNALLRYVKPDRYILHDLIRQYARKQLLEAGEAQPAA